MDTTRWKSVAVRVEDYNKLKLLCEKTYRSPGSMLGYLLNLHVPNKGPNNNDELIGNRNE